MALSAANAKAGTTGKIYVAAAGTTLPTSSQTTPNVAFKELGYVSDAGVVQSIAVTTQKIVAWQNADVIREIQTEHDLNYKFSMLETNPTVLSTFFGNFTAGKVEINGLQRERLSWVLDTIDGDDQIRLVVPYAQITAWDDVSWVNGSIIQYGVTLTAFPDPNYSGSLAAAAKAYQYIYDVSGGESA